MARYGSILVVGWICLSLGCESLTVKHGSGKSSLLRGTPPHTRESLLSQIPVGTPREDAIRIAFSLGLESTPEQNLAIQEDNHLHFQKERKQWWGGHQISLIQIECRQGKVEDIICEQIGLE